MNTAQSILFLIFIVNGILIGLLFDIFRILRRTFKTGDIITYIEDILFWLLTGASILYNIFIYNNGEIRLFMFIAIGIRSNNIFFNNKFIYYKSKCCYHKFY